MPDEVLTTAKTTEDVVLDETSKEMVDAGVFYGRKRSKTNPKMKPFIAGNRNEIEIINLAKTKEALDRALTFLEEKVKGGGMVLFVATQPAARGVEDLAKGSSYPYVVNRWLGGTLTNFKVISKRIEYLKSLKSDWQKNAFEKYTKKERVGIEREMNRLNELLGGLEIMERLPDALIVTDPTVHLAAMREAKRLAIPVISFLSTDGDPDLSKYPVPGNSKAPIGIAWFFGKVKEAIQKGKQAREKEQADAAAKAEEGKIAEIKKKEV